MTECSHLTCYDTDDDVTMYKEPTDHNDKGWMPVCGKHCDFTKDGVEVLSVNDVSSAISEEILASLQ